jgi:hypothetical protein
MTPVTGNISAEVFEALPEWCPYIAFSEPRSIGGVELAGFFVHLQYDLENRARDLHFVLDVTRSDGSTYLAPTVLRLVGNLDECFQAAFTRMRQSIESDGGRSLGFADVEQARAYVERIRENPPDELAPLLSLALYLASTTREIRSGVLTQPVPPSPQMTRHDGSRIFPPSAPRIWEVAFRIGATLRAGQAAIERRATSADGSESRPHSSPRPHMRAAHWHHYWTGPLKGERKLIVKWLHPVLVAVTEDLKDPGIVPVVHRVAAPLGAVAGCQS